MSHPQGVFQDKIFRFRDGLSMGGLLLSLVADVFMDALEHEIVQSQTNVLHYCRYVDDILRIWGGNEDELKTFHAELNSHHPAVQFTLEEGNPKLNYLDLAITLQAHGSELSPQFEIYRQNTYTGVSINSASLHPRQHKMAGIHAAIHRPMGRAAYENEISNIEKVALVNNLRVSVRQLISRKRLRKLLAKNRNPQPTTLSVRQKWMRLPYLGKSTERIAKDLRKLNYKVGFHPVTTVGQHSAVKDPSL